MVYDHKAPWPVSRFRDWTDFEASDQPLQHSRVDGGKLINAVIDHLTGKVAFPFALIATPRADFCFNVPCRFDTDHLPVVATAFHLQQVTSVPIVEIQSVNAIRPRYPSSQEAGGFGSRSQ
jgi:hypothetical protein